LFAPSKNLFCYQNFPNKINKNEKKVTQIVALQKGVQIYTTFCAYFSIMVHQSKEFEKSEKKD
jgi:hypothetical protein